MYSKDYLHGAPHVLGTMNDAADTLSHNNVSHFLSLYLSTDASSHTPIYSAESVGVDEARLGLHRFDITVCSLLSHGIAQSIAATYEMGKRHYMNFCLQFHISSLPLSEETLCHFVVFLSLKSLTYQTIKLYLSAVCHLQIINRLPDPSLSSFPRLGYVLQGIHRTGITRQSHRSCLPITPELLHVICQVWLAHPPDFTRSCCGLHSC